MPSCAKSIDIHFYEVRERLKIIIIMGERGVVLITGATGFIGRHVSRLLLKRGYRLRILTRNPDFVELKDRPGVEVRKVNYLDINTLNGIGHGIDFVIHIAGVIKGRRFDAFKKGNIYTTRNLLKAIKEEDSIKKFIFLSSQSAAGPSKDAPLTEKDEAKPVSFYGLSKKIAEEYVKNSGIPYVILRPSAVFGEGDRETLLLFKMAKRGISLSIGKGPLFNIIYVGDLVDVIVKILGSDVVNRTYFVNNGEVFTPQKLSDILKKIMGKKYLFHIRVPEAIATMFSFLGEYYAGLTGKENMITREKLRELKQYSWLASNELLRREVFDKFTSSEDALRRAYSWYIEKGWL